MLVHWFLKCWCHLLFDHFQFTLIHGPNIPSYYAILLFTASDFTSITGHIQNWVLFLFCLHPFILSGVISPLISSSILGTYRPGDFLFQYPIILPFHTVHGVLKARILKWFTICFSSGPHSVRPLHHDPPVVGGLTQHGLASLSQTRLWSLWLGWLVYCAYGLCLPCDASHNTCHLTYVSLTFDVGYLFMAAPTKHSCCSLRWMRDISSQPPLLTFNMK